MVLHVVCSMNCGGSWIHVTFNELHERQEDRLPVDIQLTSHRSPMEVLGN